MKEYTEEQKAILESLHKGPKYYTVIGWVKDDLANFKKAIPRLIKAEKIRWDELASKGPDLVLAEETGGEFPIRETVFWFPYVDLPKFPKLPEKFEEKEI